MAGCRAKTLNCPRSRGRAGNKAVKRPEEPLVRMEKEERTPPLTSVRRICTGERRGTEVRPPRGLACPSMRTVCGESNTFTVLFPLGSSFIPEPVPETTDTVAV